MRPGQLEEMVPVGGRATTSRWMSTTTALFVAMLSTEHMDPFMQMAAMHMAPSVRPGQLEEMASMAMPAMALPGSRGSTGAT